MKAQAQEERWPNDRAAPKGRAILAFSVVRLRGYGRGDVRGPRASPWAVIARPFGAEIDTRSQRKGPRQSMPLCVARGE